jgi:hypothetical protein
VVKDRLEYVSQRIFDTSSVTETVSRHIRRNISVEQKTITQETKCHRISVLAVVYMEAPDDLQIAATTSSYGVGWRSNRGPIRYDGYKQQSLVIGEDERLKQTS